MANWSIVSGYLIAPLAASITASLLLAVQVRTVEFVVQAIGWFYLIALLIGVPVCFVIRMLPTRSLGIYLLWGAVAGALAAPTVQMFSDVWSHGHQPHQVANLVWQAIRLALSGAVGLGVFWYVVGRLADAVAKKERADQHRMV